MTVDPQDEAELEDMLLHVQLEHDRKARQAQMATSLIARVSQRKGQLDVDHDLVRFDDEGRYRLLLLLLGMLKHWADGYSFDAALRALIADEPKMSWQMDGPADG